MIALGIHARCEMLLTYSVDLYRAAELRIVVSGVSKTISCAHGGVFSRRAYRGAILRHNLNMRASYYIAQHISQ